MNKVTVPGDTASTPAAPVIAFLGAGRMGGPMAANLARAGFTVHAWDEMLDGLAKYVS